MKQKHSARIALRQSGIMPLKRPAAGGSSRERDIRSCSRDELVTDAKKMITFKSERIIKAYRKRRKKDELL